MLQLGGDGQRRHSERMGVEAEDDAATRRREGRGKRQMDEESSHDRQDNPLSPPTTPESFIYLIRLPPTPLQSLSSM